MKKLLFLLPLFLMSVGCAAFQSEPIDVELADRLVENAKLMKSDMTRMANLLDDAKASKEGWSNIWVPIERKSILALADANLAVANEVLKNANAKNHVE